MSFPVPLFLMLQTRIFASTRLNGTSFQLSPLASPGADRVL